MNCMQDNTKWYWEQSPQQNNIIFPTHTFMNPCLDVMTVTEVKQKPKNLCKKNQPHKAIQRRTICLTESDHDYILDEIKRRDTI